MLQPVSFRSAAQLRQAQSVASIPTNVQANGSSASATGGINVDYFPGPGSENRSAYAAVNLQGSGMADGPTNFKVTNITIYEKGTDKPVASVENPQATMAKTEQGRGVRKETYAFGFPASKIDPSKEYAFVVTTQINGSAPKQVRTNYAPPHATF